MHTKDNRYYRTLPLALEADQPDESRLRFWFVLSPHAIVYTADTHYSCVSNPCSIPKQPIRDENSRQMEILIECDTKHLFPCSVKRAIQSDQGGNTMLTKTATLQHLRQNVRRTCSTGFRNSRQMSYFKMRSIQSLFVMLSYADANSRLSGT